VTTQQAGAPRELLADRAYVQLRDLIITLRIRPGDPIDEDRLGEALQMGRTPVREAVKRLALENLVTVFPRRGTFASDINITDLTHISEVRVVLEAHAAYRAAERITDAQRAELAELLDELSRSQGSDDGEALMALDARVHRFIHRCTGNPYLEETLGRYFNLSLRIWHLVIDRTCLRACTSTTTSCTRSPTATRRAPATSSSSTSRRSSARSATCSNECGASARRSAAR
jgi:DNA-binding GntR family transcriptional regulator